MTLRIRIAAACIGLLLLACSTPSEPAAESEDRKTTGAEPVGAGAEPVAAAAEDRGLLKRYQLSDIEPIGLASCDRIMAVDLCLLGRSPAEVQQRSATDIAALWRGWQRRLASNDPEARAALERDCAETLPVVSKIWRQLPYAAPCL